MHRNLKFEIALNLLFIALVPLLIRVLNRLSGGTGLAFAKDLGLDNDYQRFAGIGGVADIVRVPAAARGLIESAYRAYDPMEEFLFGLVGMNWPGPSEEVLMSSYTHPPFELPLGLPLAYVDYRLWLPFWMAAMAVALAASLRLVGLPAWTAYPFALIFLASYPGRESLASSYPLAGLLLACAWFFRHKSGTSGIAYALLGSLRGYGFIMLVYPLWRRQWRALIVAAGVVVTLTAIAVILEPTVIADFLDRGMGSAQLWVAYGDNSAPTRFVQSFGIPYWVLVAAVMIFTIIAWTRGHHPFWILAWASFTVTPLAWAWTLGSALPLAGWLARKSRAGSILMMIALAAVVATPIGWGISWTLLLALSAVAILCSPRRRFAAEQEGEGAAVLVRSSMPS